MTSALDPLVGKGVLNLPDRLRRERGVSCLFITRDLGVVRSIADDIAVMERGGSSKPATATRQTPAGACFAPEGELA